MDWMMLMVADALRTERIRDDLVRGIRTARKNGDVRDARPPGKDEEK